MYRMELSGAWTMTNMSDGTEYAVNVPTSNYLALMEHGVIDDPYLFENEDKVQWVSYKTWQFSRSFEVDKDLFVRKHIHMVFEQLDTLCEIYINDSRVANTSNAHTGYDFDIKAYLRCGENTLKIVFLPPYDYIAQKQQEYPLPNTVMGERGSPHLRKPQYHWSWDWGPHMVSCGITDDVYLYAYNDNKIEEIKVNQLFVKNNVQLTITTTPAEQIAGLFYEYTLTAPNGTVELFMTADSTSEYLVCEPQLWWCNGMGEQNLYTLQCRLLLRGEVLDTRELVIGLRTLELDTHTDKFGDDFCFRLNGYEVFARGADWITPDCFVNRISSERLEYLISEAARANMNMLRVWGGAYYGSDEFYSLCDRYGIMVWQDFMFACSPFNWFEPTFLASVRDEIVYNVKRIRHHASLALWCGNNEIEAIQFRWARNREMIKNCKRFFHEWLPDLLRTMDDITSYRASSPSAGPFADKRANTDKAGDTHLWQVWHGLKPLDYYQKRFTRFCSEFGVESLPSENALDIFAGDEELSFESPVMQVHQKCGSGNEKMLFYVLSRFFRPQNFRDYVMLTQLVQMECIQNATEHWRRNKGICNGALYWQYDDCWGVNSWSGLDYYGNLKALQYRARHFNAPIALSIVRDGKSAELFLLNDSLRNARVKITVCIATTDGEKLVFEEMHQTAKRQNVVSLKTYDMKAFPVKAHKIYLEARMHDEQGKELWCGGIFFGRDISTKLPQNTLSYTLRREDNLWCIDLTSEGYNRFVELRLRGVSTPFSDNYFSMYAGEEKTITIASDMPVEDVREKLRVRTLADIPQTGTVTQNRNEKLKIFLRPVNFINWVYRSFD